MDLMSINEEIRNAIEHYACRSSTKCVKLEDFRQLIGGSYTWNTCIDFTMASNIFKIFCNISSKVESEEGKYSHCKTIKEANFSEGNVSYRIHIFSTKCTNAQKRHVCVHAGILLKFNFNVGYTRIYKMPCKFTILKIILHIKISTFYFLEFNLV